MSGPASNGSAEARTIGVLISGRGSNQQALIDSIAVGRLEARIGLVVSNRPGAAGLARAASAGLETLVVDHRACGSRDDFDRAVARELLERGVRLVCLAGFMRLVGAPLLDAFPDAILNVHPSLLPAFPGVDAQRQALEYGVRITGATVHLVTRELDAGPIVLQEGVPVLSDDSVDTLSARILVAEHRLYPAAVQLILDGGWVLTGRRFIPPATYHTPGINL